MKGRPPSDSWDFSVGLEEGPDGSALVHALSLPGCIASGRSKDEALDAFSIALSEWLDFLGDRGHNVPGRDTELQITVDEWIATDADVATRQSNVCFEHDRLPLDDAALRRGLRTLGELRARLLPRIRRAKDQDLETYGAPALNARMILDELARAHWFTLTRLGSSPLAEVPERVVARLDTSMALIVQHLGHLAADARARSVVLDGEEWTPRKVLRHLLWLEWELGGAALHAMGDTQLTTR